MQRDITIQGMHCASCEILLEEKIRMIPDTKVIHISHKTGRLTLEVKNEISLEKIKEVIHQQGYTIVEGKEKKDGKEKINFDYKSWISIGIVILIVLLFLFGGMHMIPNFDQMNIGVAFLLGIVASLSTCLAVTGGIVMGYSEQLESKHPRKTQLLFHGGRIVAFFLGGLLLGLIGKGIGVHPAFNITLTLLVGILILYLGIQSLGILPNISKRGFHLPKSIGKRILKIKDPKYAALVGALTFFLPCGFTQSMQLFALQTGDAFQGGILMAMFALGTMPVLLGLGVGTAYIKEKISFFRPLLASLLIIFGIFSIYNALSLAKVQSSNIFSPQNINEGIPKEIINVTHNGYEFSPYTISLQQGKQYIIRVTPTANGKGCMYALAYGGKVYDIKKNQTFEIEVDASKAGTLPLVCASMGMRQGLIVIE